MTGPKKVKGPDFRTFSLSTWPHFYNVNITNEKSPVQFAFPLLIARYPRVLRISSSWPYRDHKMAHHYFRAACLKMNASTRPGTNSGAAGWRYVTPLAQQGSQLRRPLHKVVNRPLPDSFRAFAVLAYPTDQLIDKLEKKFHRN